MLLGSHSPLDNAAFLIKAAHPTQIVDKYDNSR
jgi:hypothetical protein